MNRITPRVDFAFKKLFGSEENKALPISLINSMVREADQVADIVPPEHFPELYTACRRLHP